MQELKSEGLLQEDEVKLPFLATHTGLLTVATMTAASTALFLLDPVAGLASTAATIYALDRASKWFAHKIRDEELRLLVEETYRPNARYASDDYVEYGKISY